jgi:predicted transposase YbfD/YdcC
MLKLSGLGEVVDARRGQGRMYDLPHVLLCSVLAVVAGADSYRGIFRFINARLEWLREHSGLKWRRAPSHTGLRKILLGLDQAGVEQALRRQSSAALAAEADGKIVTVAIDGKTLRGSLDRFADVAALQWLSAFATGQRLVLGQVCWGSGDKGDEISGAQRLIAELGLNGVLFTLDALHCQKKTVQVVLDSGSDVLVQVKANQPTLLDTLTDLAAQTPPADTHLHHQIGQRNRIETRHTAVWTVPKDHLEPEWSPLCCLVQVSRHTECFDTTLGKWIPRGETAWYACTRPLSATQAYHVVRDHWQIENGFHYVRDVTMGEDDSRIRTAPGVFAQLRTCALNLLRQAGHKSIKAARQTIGWSEKELRAIWHQMQQ